MEKLLKKENKRGITLISLVITIIVLLILAGVTINLTIGEGGIITKAQEAGKNMLLAQEQENEELNKLYSSMQIATNDNSQITISMTDLKSLIDSSVNSKVQELKEEIDELNSSLDEIKNPQYSTTEINIWENVSGAHTTTMTADAILKIKSSSSTATNTNGVYITINGILRRIWSAHKVSYTEIDVSTFEVKKGDVITITTGDGATYSASYYLKE